LASLSRAAAKACTVAGRDNDQVPLARGEDTLVGEHLGGSGDDVEQFAGAM
jgi:hypothetical protein